MEYAITSIKTLSESLGIYAWCMLVWVCRWNA
jgi:hypothetical protein